MSDSIKALRVHPHDNVIVALRDLASGERVDVDGKTYTLQEDVPAKHKFTDSDLAKGATVTMYGLTVGKADLAIALGKRISTKNVIHAVQAAHVAGSASAWPPPDVSRWTNMTFEGYHRANGSVGTANQWLVIPLVFCENRNLMLMKEALLGPLGYGLSSPYEHYVQNLTRAYVSGRVLPEMSPDTDKASPATAQLFPNVDGVKFLSHTMGCGGTDRDCESLAGLLAGYVAHPNVAGTTVLSLGCQKTQLDQLREEIHRRDPSFSKPLHFFRSQ